MFAFGQDIRSANGDNDRQFTAVSADNKYQEYPASLKTKI